MKKILIILSLVLIANQSVAKPARRFSIKDASLQLKPCEIAGIKQKTLCGNLAVFENRATRKGREINLKIIVVPATGPDRLPDPLFYIAGGPGSSATEEAPGFTAQLAPILKRRDFVFVDQRGTGGSNALKCAFFDSSDAQSYFGYFFPLNDVKKCYEELKNKADLTLYTTPIAMDDLDDVREALGYQRINIFGGSYGTRASLVYLRQHPDHVRSIILQGVVPTADHIPLDFARRNERALQGVVNECDTDEACHKAFPTLNADVSAVLARLLKGAVEVEIKLNGAVAGNSSKTAKVSLSRDLAAEAIRYMLYSASGASRVPLFLHQAAIGNFVPLAQAALNFREGIVSSGSNGMYLSVTCAEDLPGSDPSEAKRLAENTFLGDYRFRQQSEACALWTRAKVPQGYFKPVRSKAPVLILTGQWDPVTPPSNGDEAARYLPNSRHIIVPHGGHGFGGLEGLACIQNLVSDFIEKGAADSLDTNCVQGIKRRGFVLKL